MTRSLRAAGAVLFTATFILVPLASAASCLDQEGAAFVKPTACTDTTIDKISDRFHKAIGSNPGDLSEGMLISFKSGLSLISYETSDVAAQERPGDPVQVCFSGEIRHTAACDPNHDDRGRVYRIYDYRRGAAYVVMNSQRMCGEG